jgi:predicted RNA-binding protein with PIN domain
MHYLIDGYNLLHALGRLTAKAGKHALDSARKGLLIQLVTWHGADARDVTVVFDAASQPAGPPGESEHGGVRVLFSSGQTADDLIEELLRDEPSPKRLTVVSDDHRIQHAARRRGCAVLDCLDYCERAQQRPVAAPVPPEPAGKPEGVAPEEVERWLDVFREADEP